MNPRWLEYRVLELGSRFTTSQVVELAHPRGYVGAMVHGDVGRMLRDWRHRRRRSQLNLAVEVGVSARHLGFVETGRSRPSPELIGALADHLDVPLRERNRMLLAAGFAPRYGETPLDSTSMRRARLALQRMLDAHDPYPGVVIDRAWNVVVSNAGARALTLGLPSEVLDPRVNVFRVCLHPKGLAGHTLNFDEWAAYLVGQIRRLAELTADADVAALEAEVMSYPGVAQLSPGPADYRWDDQPLLVPFTVEVGGQRVSLFTTLTTFGTPRDVTLEELSVELFFPADDATDELLVAGINRRAASA